MRRLAAIAAAVLVLSACAPAGPGASPSASAVGTLDQIEVGTSDTGAPTISFPAGVPFTRADSTMVWDGEGTRLENGQPILLDIYGTSLIDGTVIINTYDGLPRSYVLAREVLGDGLYERLIGAHVGARVLLIAPPADPAGTEPPVVMVVDVLSERASGTAVAPRSDLPSVRLTQTGEPVITIPKGAKEPTELQIQTLIQGDGEQVKEGSFIIANYKAVYFKDGKLFDSSWPEGKAPFETRIGTGQVIRGWDEGLLDQTAGSQVLLVVPPSYAYPDKGALVFVVDILDVWSP